MKCSPVQPVAPFPPGTNIMLYGHSFLIQEDGTPVAEIPNEIAQQGIKAGRYKPVATAGPKSPAPAPEKATEEAPALTDFEKGALANLTMDIGNYYGAGDLSKLMIRVLKAKTDHVRQFAKEWLGLEFSSSMQKSTMAEKIKEEIKKRKVE